MLLQPDCFASKESFLKKKKDFASSSSPQLLLSSKFEMIIVRLVSFIFVVKMKSVENNEQLKFADSATLLNYDWKSLHAFLIIPTNKTD